MKMTDELWNELGFTKDEKKKLYIHNYFQKMIFDFNYAETLDLKTTAKLIQKYISKESYNSGRSYVQNSIIKALGLDYVLDNIKKCL